MFGIILSINTAPNNILVLFVRANNETMTKIKLQRKFLMAYISKVLLEINPPLRGLKPLKVLKSLQRLQHYFREEIETCPLR